MEYNKNSLDTLCGALAYAMGITPPTECGEKNEELSVYVDATHISSSVCICSAR